MDIQEYLLFMNSLLPHGTVPCSLITVLMQVEQYTGHTQEQKCMISDEFEALSVERVDPAKSGFQVLAFEVSY